MNLPKLLLRHRALIIEGLTKALHGESSLHAILRYHVGLEDRQGKPIEGVGKLLRPSLLLFVVEELRGDVEKALPGALSVELTHNFSLIHDDIEDRDLLRRGRATVWSLYGVEQGINAGDLMQAVAMSQALIAGRAEASALSEATAEMIEGQGLDLQFEQEEIGIARYLEMVDKKTGALIRCAFRLGALLAGASPILEETLMAVGQELGRAFQIRDDLLGIWGDGVQTGKPQGSDIRQKKKTLPIAVAFARAVGEECAILRQIYGKEEVTNTDVERVIMVLEKLGAKDVGEKMVADHLSHADNKLRDVPLSARGKEEMNELIDYLARRER